MDGVLTCTRYAFAPNYYKYCGPDANRDITGYLSEGVSDPGLVHHLQEFAVLFPYLRFIAQENGIQDPFDPKVVEAYWIGNGLLKNIGMKAFSDHLLDDQQLKSKIPKKALKWVMEKISKGASVHHSFHVFSIFTRTGHHAVEHTIETMDSCRIGWGKIIQKSEVRSQKSGIKILSQKLEYKNSKLRLKDNVIREVVLPITSDLSSSIKIGDWVSFHWGFVCDKISITQAKQLEYYTRLNLQLANETI